MGEMVATHRKTYSVQANWKLLIENFLEYYHLPAVHPALCNVSGVDEHQRYQGRGMYMGFATDPLTKGGTPLDPGRLPPFPTIEVRPELRSVPSTRCKAPSTCARALRAWRDAASLREVYGRLERALASLVHRRRRAAWNTWQDVTTTQREALAMLRAAAASLLASALR